MSQGEGRLEQGDAITHFRVSIAKEERFAEFYTGEGADGRLHDASGQPGYRFAGRFSARLTLSAVWTLAGNASESHR
jgi:hypothetical protein